MTIEEIIKEAFSRVWNASHECATDFDYDCALNGFLSEVETEVKKFRIGAVVRSLPSDEFLKKLFQNNSDCYADTWTQDGLGAPMVEGEVIQAMTVEQFIKVVKSIWQ